MSLINDALKKAQHQRTGPMDSPPMPGGGSGGGRVRQGMPTQLLILLIAGAVAVIAISVITTVYFINRTPAPKVAIAVPPPAPVAVTTNPTPAPLTGTATTASTVSAPSPVIIGPVIVHAPPPPVIEMPALPPPVVEEPAAAAVTTPAPEPANEGSLQERIETYVEKVRVTGIRTSDSGSKVLMNDKVYRVNDIVDRKLGLRLVKIATDSLTFADANGATYVKSF